MPEDITGSLRQSRRKSLAEKHTMGKNSEILKEDFEKVRAERERRSNIVETP